MENMGATEELELEKRSLALAHIFNDEVMLRRTDAEKSIDKYTM